jgi:hypothetical protein
MIISLRKTLPTTGTYYTSGGDVTITIIGVQEVVIHSKKELQNIQKPASKNTQDANPTDEFNNLILDLKKGVDEINIKGWIEDDLTDTAWNKFWKLRAMCSRGGSLYEVTIGDKVFSSSTQEIFLEDIQGTYNPDDTENIQTTKANGTARIQVRLNLLVGDSR